MEPPFKHAVTENLPTSDCDGEDEVADAGDSKPPSPLSVQQDGGILPVQSPPFENEPAEKPSSTMSDCSNRLELHADGDQSVENSDIDCLEPGTTTAWKSDVQIVVPSKLAIPVKQTISTSSECGGDSEPGNSVVAVEPSSATKSSKQKLFASSTNPSSPSRTLPVKKSVQQLYGQPSWWGDGEDNYSYPHTSLLGAQNAAEVASNKEVTPNRVDDGDDVDADSKPQPRCEAFVIDFGQGESRGSVPGSLSQCVPDRLRRGFDERERLKREREKENELRRQTIPSQLSPIRQNSQRSTRSVALRAANAKQVASGRPSTASAAGGAPRGGRSQLSTTRPSTAAPTSRGAALSSTRPTGARVVRANSSNSPVPSTPRRTPGSIPSSPLVRAPRTAGSASVTPRQVNAPRTRDVVSGAINRVSALQATTTRAGVTPARKPTVTGTGTRTAAVRQLSQCTDRSSASRRTAPSGPTKPGTLGVKPAVTVASRTARTTAPGPSTPAKTAETSKVRAGSQSRQPVTRGFMSATTSSGAKRVTPVQPSKTNRTAAAMSQKPQPQQTRTSFGPPLGNSAKRPVTTTQLRRPASSTRTPIRRSYTDLADKRVLAQPRGSLPRIQYEASASVMAAIDAYDDPKAYLFYRMFQGSELDETSTDSVFRTFTPEFPDPSARQEESRDAIQQPVSSPEDWPLNGVDSTLIGRSAPETVDPPELSTTNRAQRSQRSSVTRPEPPSIDTVRHSQSSPTVEQTAHAVPITVSQPTASACSPKFQHRPLSALGSSPTENNTLNMSMLVATSVTSLAATYNLDPGETLADRGLITPQPTCADQLTTPRGSLTCLKETEEEQEDEAEHAGSHSYRPLSHLTENHNRRSSTQPTETKFQASPHAGSRLRTGQRSTVQLKRYSNDPPDLTASADLPTATSTTNLTGQTNNTSTLSSGALFETCRDDIDLDRAQTSARSADAFNTSALVSASAISLAPSLAATYVMDMDDTLAAQGLVPAVVVESREDLLLSPTRDLRSALGIRSAMRAERGTASNTVSDGLPDTSARTAQAVTPQGGLLWDVLETEECTEDVDFDNMILEGDEQEILAGLESHLDSELTVASEDEEEELECYQSLPQPSALNDRIPSGQELEARSHRTYVNTDPVSLGQPGVCSTGSGESRRVASITRPTSVGIMGCSGSNAPEKVILTPVEAKLSSSPGLGAQSQRGSAVLLKRPECSPSSTSTSPPSASSQIEATAAAAPSNRAAPHEAFPNSRRCAPPELTSPEPRSTYAPLTDIHNCYRALQQSVNYLIQSQTGLLAAVDTEADRESAGAFGFAAVERSNEYEHGPLSRVGQGNGCSATSQAAARWPPDLTLPSEGGATNGARRSLSRRHRADRKRQSTASLDSALQRWDDSGTTPTDDSVRQLRRQPQQAGSNFRDPRSASAASGDRRKALTPKSADEDTFRLSSALDRNITASGDSGLQSYSASLSQSEQKSHPAIAAEQLGHTYRAAQSFRTGSSSVPEPASPTGSGSSHSATHEWCPSQRQPVCLDPSRSAATTTTRASNPLNRTYDFSGQNGPQILSRITHGDDFAPTTERIQPPSLPSSSMSGSFVNGSTKPAEASLEVPTFDSRTFTRRKGPNLTDHTGAPAFDANSYQAWLAGMSALSQGIDSLSKAPLFRPSRESDAGPTTKRPSAGHIGSVSDLPDSTTDSPMPNEPVRSAFITPIPQRSLGVPHVGLSRPANLASGQLCMQQIPDDPNEAAAYYTLMVDSIRQLSLKLRQCSDKLVQRVNADQSAALISSPTGRRASRASSTDSVPTSTKYALSDALENMRTINHQLKMVDELLFSHGWNEAQLQRQDQMSGEIARDGTVNHARLGQADPNHFTFIPIQPENQGPGVSSPAKARATTDSKVSRAACVSCANNTKSGKANATSSAGHQVGLVQPRGNPSRRALMDEEDEYY